FRVKQRMSLPLGFRSFRHSSFVIPSSFGIRHLSLTHGLPRPVSKCDCEARRGRPALRRGTTAENACAWGYHAHSGRANFTRGSRAEDERTWRNGELENFG